MLVVDIGEINGLKGFLMNQEGGLNGHIDKKKSAAGDLIHQQIVGLPLDHMAVHVGDEIGDMVVIGQHLPGRLRVRGGLKTAVELVGIGADGLKKKINRLGGQDSRRKNSKKGEGKEKPIYSQGGNFRLSSICVF
jgi:hypothetical protein